mgnify:CR=1 FL=1
MLLAAGCYFVRPGKGDHEIWYSPVTEVKFVVDAKILLTCPVIFGPVES